MQHRRLAVLVSTVLLLASCTDGVTGDASPPAPAPSSTTPPSGEGPMPTPPLPDDPSFPSDTDADGGPGQPGSDDDAPGTAGISGLRLSAQEGYSRLVVDLGTSGVPEWSVGYSEPTDPGGGPVDISGDAFLRVQVRTSAQPPGGTTTRVRTSPGPIVEAISTGLLQGQAELLIGIDGGEQPFRAFALTDPGRIVVDVRYGP
jgi:hypothetical protein